MSDVASAKRASSDRDDKRPSKRLATGTGPTDIVERFLEDPDGLRFPEDLGHAILTVPNAKEIMWHCENPDDEAADPSYPGVYNYCMQVVEAAEERADEDEITQLVLS